MKEKILLFVKALSEGNELENVVEWKRRNIKTNLISLITIGIFALGIFYGIELNLTAEEVAVIASLILAVFNGVNALMQIVTSRKVGLRTKTINQQPKDNIGNRGASEQTEITTDGDIQI